MLIFYSINPGFDAEVTEKFLNGIYYSLAETEPWRNRWTFMDGFTVTTLLMLNCQSGCIFFWKTDLAITILLLYYFFQNIKIVSKQMSLLNDRFMTISGHFFAIGIFIFHKTEVQIKVLNGSKIWYLQI